MCICNVLLYSFWQAMDKGSTATKYMHNILYHRIYIKIKLSVSGSGPDRAPRPVGIGAKIVLCK